MQQQKTITLHPKSVFLAEPRGFCAGVKRAIEIVERSIEVFGAPVYVRHEIVHNKHVVGAAAPTEKPSGRDRSSRR